MSYFDDYIADGLCCESCGDFIDTNEPGFVRQCAGCRKPAPKPKDKSKTQKREAA